MRKNSSPRVKPYPLPPPFVLINAATSGLIAHEQRAGIIVVTHDHRALDVFDRVFEMEDGLLRAHAA
jgi:hypothetical protein